MVRRRPGKEGKYKKELRAYRLGDSRYRCHNADGPPQPLRSGRLNDKVSDVTKRAIGLNRLTVRVYVPGLHNPAESDQCTAKNAKHYPQQTRCS